MARMDGMVMWPAGSHVFVLFSLFIHPSLSLLVDIYLPFSHISSDNYKRMERDNFYVTACEGKHIRGGEVESGGQGSLPAFPYTDLAIQGP
ncbi:hypothetical protein BO78DRAFT_17299 [Aspergillus sclerotiicarbonarius CBS 121057]|uniref:Uncharacterized protein n=1 Tax=Aspergillus sclerotiicarbonarius (strain CBS 121057 / IBT 28362) TaxID=1448318 RepID=A0A319DUL6_ASPSB|nr:hypothetical protein BO78DRAFT_17299 [Aspergillus sclerotiicarbonarius CBS 121057]